MEDFEAPIVEPFVVNTVLRDLNKIKTHLSYVKDPTKLEAARLQLIIIERNVRQLKELLI